MNLINQYAIYRNVPIETVQYVAQHWDPITQTEQFELELNQLLDISDTSENGMIQQVLS